jgi:Fe-S-cluster containining protein
MRPFSVICDLKMEHKAELAPSFCLRMHAGYRCRHSGACCTAGWAIPVEGPVYERLKVHFAGRHGPLFATGGPLPEGAAGVLDTERDGACVFFEANRGNLCAVHRELGADWLPDACRQFPRVVLQDARGTLLSLSHFCPTAAALLHSIGPPAFEIVPAPTTIALDGNVEGLDAREALAPLLRPGMLTDHDGYDAWERRAIGVLGRGNCTADQSLAVLETATLAVQSWRPGGSSLRETVNREFDVASAGKPDKNLDASGSSPERLDEWRVRLALSSIPPGLPCPPLIDRWRDEWASVSTWWAEFDGAVRGYLAARLFGNWIAYHGQGLHAIVEYLQVALAVVKMEAARHHVRESPSTPWQTVTEALRSADLLLVHLSDTRALSSQLGRSQLR